MMGRIDKGLIWRLHRRSTTTSVTAALGLLQVAPVELVHGCFVQHEVQEVEETTKLNGEITGACDFQIELKKWLEGVLIQRKNRELFCLCDVTRQNKPFFC